MKSLLLTFIILFLTIFPANCQTIEGTYANKWQAKSGEAISYTITLDKDGTFSFQSVISYKESFPDKLVEAQGTWRLDGHLLVLTTEGTLTKLSTNLNMNKARFSNISPRNPKFNLVKPSLKFYHSQVFYAKNMELIKVGTDLTAN